MKFSILQKVAFAYSALFIIVVLMGYVPAFVDAEGYLFGVFHIDPIDDIVHLVSGLWALLAGLKGRNSAIFYFRLFGTIYFLDGVLGVLFGKGFLDFAIFLSVPGISDMATRIAANIPHIVVGGLAMIIGFKSRKKQK